MTIMGIINVLRSVLKHIQLSILVCQDGKNEKLEIYQREMSKHEKKVYTK